MDIFTMVKAAVTVRQAAEHYGLQVNRNGMALCPFHMTVTRACMYRMTTTTVSLWGAWGCDRPDCQTV